MTPGLSYPDLRGGAEQTATEYSRQSGVDHSSIPSVLELTSINVEPDS